MGTNKTPGTGDTAGAFETIREARLTDDGKACVAIAEAMYEVDSTEARQWCKLGLDCDNAQTPHQLADLRKKLVAKAERASKTAAMRNVAELKVVGGSS